MPVIDSCSSCAPSLAYLSIFSDYFGGTCRVPGCSIPQYDSVWEYMSPTFRVIFTLMVTGISLMFLICATSLLVSALFSHYGYHTVAVPPPPVNILQVAKTVRIHEVGDMGNTYIHVLMKFDMFGSF